MLIGKTVTGFFVAKDGKALRFDVLDRDDPIIVKVDGDCCSASWVEGVENPEAAVGAEILEAEDIPMPTHPFDADEYDVVAFYGFKISTVKGTCVVDYRNSSNGYYGGNLVWPGDDYFYGGVHGQNVSAYVWRELAKVEDPRK